MKLAWHHDAESARYYFDAEVGDYDGVPAVNRLYTDREILFVKDDVMNAAAFLAFATYCSGQLQMPKSCSPELAEAIQEFLKPTWSAVSPIVMQPREAPVGDGLRF